MTDFDKLEIRTKANLKGQEVLRLLKKEKNNRKKYEIEVIDIKTINGGVEVYARVSRGGKQIGFGKDGTVDIERFKIFNPPILVPDKNGEILRHTPASKLHPVETFDRYRKDPKEAILQAIEHTVDVKKQKFNDAKIVVGKIGNTTSTFYPAAGANSPVDGSVYYDPSSTTWSAIHDYTGTATAAYVTQNWVYSGGMQCSSTTNQWKGIIRGYVLFDTSSIGATDTIDSATFSLYGQWKDSNTDVSYNVYSGIPDSDSNITTSDFDYNQFGTTAYSSAITHSSYSTAGYNDWVFNATGEAAIARNGETKPAGGNNSGITYLGLRCVADADDSEPSYVTSAFRRAYGYSADETGTSKDPKLVVEHTSAGGSTFTPRVMMF